MKMMEKRRGRDETDGIEVEKRERRGREG